MSRLFDLAHAATTDDWYTPPWIFELMGVRFDVDVAAPPGGVPWIPADKWYDEAIDGLAQEWEGFVWCNPPFSEPAPWCHKWAAHGNGIILLRSDLSTSGPAAAFKRATSIFVPTPRLQFVNGHGDTSGSVNFSTVLLGAGERAFFALNRLSPRGVWRELAT